VSVDKARSRNARLRALEIYEIFYTATEEMYVNLFEQRVKIIDIKRAIGALVEKIVSGVDEKNRCLFEIITNIDFGNRFISHSVKTAIIAVTFGKCLQLPEGKLTAMATGSLLHDIGTCNSKNVYLNSYIPAYKNSHERKLAHPEISSRIIADFFGFGVDAAQVARNHHEQLDGSGYPRKVAGSEINLLDRIVFTANFIEDLLAYTEFSGMEKLNIALLFSFKKFPWKFDSAIQDAFREFAKRPVVSRRQYERAEITLAAHYRTAEGSRNTPSRILDLSGGGARMRCRERLETGSFISVSFAIGQVLAVNEASCKVVRCISEENGYTYGLLFEDKDHVLGEKIDRYLQRSSLKA
jgi:hypothetical protein